MGKSFRSRVDWARVRDFTVGGPLPDGKEWSETFRLLPAVPPDVLDASLNLASQAMQHGLQNVPPPMMVSIIRDCLVPDDVARFRALTADTNRLVDPETWAEVFAEVMEVVADRPTSLPPTPTPGGSPTGPSWTAPASGPGSTSGTSTPQPG